MSSIIKRDWIGETTSEIPGFVIPTDRPDVAALRLRVLSGSGSIDDDRDELDAEAGSDAVTDAKDAAAHAEAILLQARADAERIMAEARKAAIALREQARAEGYEAGRAAGIEEARRSYARGLDVMQRAAQAIVDNTESLISESQPEMARLAVEVAEKVIRRAVEQDPDVVLGLVREAVARSTGARNIVVRVNPEDLEVVLNAYDGLMESSPDLKSIKVVEDPRIERGGCVVETEVGVIDARIDEQIREIDRAFQGEAVNVS